MLFTEQTFMRHRGTVPKKVTTVFCKSDMKIMKTYYVAIKIYLNTSTLPDGHPLEGMGVHHVNRNLKADLSVRARS